MGKASITIAVGALWEGQPELSKAEKAADSMAARMSRLNSSTTSALANSGKSWQDLGSKVYDVSQTIGNVGDALIKSVTEPAVAMGTYAVSQAVAFDTSLANLNKTADLTEGELSKLAAAALESSKTSPVTATQILDAEALGAQLGITTDHLQEFSDVANGLDIATSMDMETAATQMAQFANITGMGQDQMSNYGSTIVDLGNHLATTEGDISNMALRLAGMTTSANFSQAEVLGLAGAMSSLGVKAEAGGSAMTQIVAGITTTVAAGGEALEAYAEVAGMSAEEFSNAWKSDPISVIETLVDNIHNLSENGQAADVTLGKLGITSIRQADVMRRLAGNTDVMHEALDRANSAWEENTALTAEVEKRNESLESRFQTLQNKVDAAAVEIGTPLAEALLDVADDLEPVITAVADGCEAFADMDTGSQQAALGLAAAATAAGPVLKVVGNVGKAAANLATGFGKAQSAAAVLGDAMATTDGSFIRVYSSTDTLSARLGTLSNSAVKAAGGAGKYVSAWEKMNDAAKTVTTSQDKIAAAQEKVAGASDKAKAKIEQQVAALMQQRDQALKSYESNAQLVSAWSGSTKEAEKAAVAAEKASKSYQASSAGCKELRSSLANVGQGYQQSAAQAKTAATEAEAVGTAVQAGATKAEVAIAGVKAALGGIAIAAAVAAIGALVTAFAEAVREEQLFEAATASAADIMSGAAADSAKYGDSLTGVTADVEGCLQSMAKLNSSVSSAAAEVMGSSAKLDTYTEAIERLAGKSNLTASEQWQLKNAVDKYNETCGTSYKVVDELNGVLSDQNGNELDLSGSTEENTKKISENTDALVKNAEAWKTSARAKAYSNVASQYIEEEAKQTLELSKAQAELEDAQDSLAKQTDYYNGLVADGVLQQEDADVAIAAYRTSVESAQKKVDELSEAMKTAGESSTYFETMATLAATGLDDNLCMSLESLEAKMPGVGAGIAQSLAGGISNGTVSVETATEFLNSGVVSKLSSLSGETAGYGQVLCQRLADGIGAGTVTVTQAQDALNSYLSQGITGLSEYYQQQGWELPDSLASGMQSNSESVTSGLSALEDTFRDGLNLLPDDAKATGSDASAGLAEGLAANAGAVGASASSLVSSAESGVSPLDGSMGKTGTSSGKSLASSLAAQSGLVEGASSSLYGAATNATAGTAATMGAQGSTAGTRYASELGALCTSAAASGSSLFRSATNATSGTAATMGAQGSQGGSAYASGVGSATGSASSAGSSLADAASSGASGWEAYTSGSHLGSQFASGLGSAWGAVKSYASSLVEAAKSVMGFSVPKEGPWSGAERGGETSGRHLAENFAAGMTRGVPSVRAATAALAAATVPDLPAYVSRGYVPSTSVYAQGGTGSRSTVNNNYTLSIGGVEVRNLSQGGTEHLKALLAEVGLTAGMGV